MGTQDSLSCVHWTLLSIVHRTVVSNVHKTVVSNVHRTVVSNVHKTGVVSNVHAECVRMRTHHKALINFQQTTFAHLESGNKSFEPMP